MRRADIWSGAILLAAALLMLFVVIPWQIAPAPDGYVSPRLVPRIMMAFIAGLAALQVFNAWRNTPAQDNQPIRRGEMVALAGISGVFAGALALYFWIGPLAAGIALICGTLAVLGERRVWMMVAMPAGLLFAVWFVFYRVLGTAIV